MPRKHNWHRDPERSRKPFFLLMEGVSFFAKKFEGDGVTTRFQLVLGIITASPDAQIKVKLDPQQKEVFTQMELLTYGVEYAEAGPIVVFPKPIPVGTPFEIQYSHSG